MKRWILLFALGFCLQINAQVSGEIIRDGRKIISGIPYTMTGQQSGVFVFEIAVNMDGIVTHCVLLQDQSTLVSTPLMMKAKNSILKNLRFERGYHFPEFHRGLVTIEVVSA